MGQPRRLFKLLDVVGDDVLVEHREHLLVRGHEDGHGELLRRRHVSALGREVAQLRELEHGPAERPAHEVGRVADDTPAAVQRDVARRLGRARVVDLRAPPAAPRRLREAGAHARPDLERAGADDADDEEDRVLRVALREVDEKGADARRGVAREHAVVREHGAEVLGEELALGAVVEREEELGALARCAERRDERADLEEDVEELGRRRARDAAREPRVRPAVARTAEQRALGNRRRGEGRDRGRGRRANRERVRARLCGPAERVRAGVEVRERDLERIHAHGAHPAARVAFAVDVDRRERAPGRVADDDVEALRDVPAREPEHALAPEPGRLLGTERLREQLPAREVERLDVRADDTERAVLAPGEVRVQQRVPLAQRGRNFVDERLRRAGGRVVAGLERRPWRRGLDAAALRRRRRGRARADARRLDRERGPRRGRLLRRGRESRRREPRGLARRAVRVRVLLARRGLRPRRQVVEDDAPVRASVRAPVRTPVCAPAVAARNGSEALLGVRDPVALEDVRGREDAERDLLDVLGRALVSANCGGRRIGMGRPIYRRAAGRGDDVAGRGLEHTHNRSGRNTHPRYQIPSTSFPRGT
jgi:hypothetical protein